MNIVKKLGRSSAVLVGAGLTLQAASSFAARCDYLVQSDWNNGFVAAIRITNDTATPINGWSVNWSYSDGTRRTGGWNANFSGNNPYSASGVGWNDRIQPGQAIEFGVQGVKGVANSPAQRPSVTGAICTNGVSSSNASSAVSSPRSSSSSSSSLSSSSRVSSSLPSSSVVSSSFSSSSLVPSSMSSSSVPNTAPPVANLQITAHGLTVYVDGSDSTDPDGQSLDYQIDFGDGKTIVYPHAWHSYQQAGEYAVVLTVSDGSSQSTQTQMVNVQPSSGNQAPIARLTTTREYYSISARAGSSYDEEGVPLTFEWDFGDGAFSGNPRESIYDCNGQGDTSIRTRLVTLTVSDGELKNTIQRTAGGRCGTVYDVLPFADFNYQIEGNQLRVDGSNSRDETGFSWSFGDGATAQGLRADHTYTAPGTYDVRLTLSGPSLFSNSVTKTVVIGTPSSTASSHSSSSSMSFSSVSLMSSSSSISTSSSSSTSSAVAVSSIIASSAMTTSSQVSSQLSSSQASVMPNHYNAPRATTAPVIDGAIDAVWARADWAPINVFWLGTQPNPSAADFSGRYKALWDEDYLYILYDITDDVIFDGVRDPLDRYWEDDTVELFIDENKNGGQHGYNTSAWAYHISTYLDVVDSTTGGAKLLNDHIETRLVSTGNKHLWEMRIRIYGEDYADWKANTPLKLFSGKLMGFSACYIDNDGSSQRESMMGSVDTIGHKNNQGYLDASVFGSMRLID